MAKASSKAEKSAFGEFARDLATVCLVGLVALTGIDVLVD